MLPIPFSLCQALERIEESPGTFTGKDIFPEILVLGDTNPAIGFCISMMYSIVFSLALNTVTQNHGSFAGILCSGIVGGAGGPLLVSLVSDATSLRTGMLLILVFMGYITFIGFWAHPLVNNKTVSLKELVTFKKQK